MDAFLLLLLQLLWCASSAVSNDVQEDPKQYSQDQQHTEELDDDSRNHHAVILSASRYWFNYRHTANALSIYQLLRRQGFPDDHIVLMIADEYGVNPRNPVKNRIYNTARDGITTSHSFYERPTLLQDDTEIDYRGEDVTVDNFVRVLTGRGGENMPVLNSNEDSHVLVYMTGHGGDSFFKFQDVEEILAEQLAESLRQMHVAGKYKQLLLIADTCQAFTLFDKIIEHEVPNVSVIGSSLREQSSYAHQTDPTLGLSVIEKYTHFFTEHIRKSNNNDQSLFDALIAPFARHLLGADLGWAFTPGARNFTDVPFRDFFVNTAAANSDRRTTIRENLPPPRLLTVDPTAPNWTLLSSKLSNRQPFSRKSTSSRLSDTKTCSAGSEHETQCFYAPLSTLSSADNSTLKTTSDALVEVLLEQLPGTEPSHPIFVASVVLIAMSSLLAGIVW